METVKNLFLAVCLFLKWVFFIVYGFMIILSVMTLMFMGMDPKETIPFMIYVGFPVLASVGLIYAYLKVTKKL